MERLRRCDYSDAVIIYGDPTDKLSGPRPAMTWYYESYKAAKLPIFQFQVNRLFSIAMQVLS